MATVDPRTHSRFERPIRDAYRALRAIVPSDYATVPADDDEDLSTIVDELDTVYRLANEAIHAERGPRMSWLGEQEGDQWPIDVLVIDVDTDTHTDPVGVYGPEEWEPDEWNQSALARAAYAYKRECRWDASPGPAGVWLVAAAPYRWIMGTYYGNLAGFLVVHDRDGDGQYESIAHMWTASAWRRRGVAAQLVNAARDRFPISDVEGPITGNGTALLASVADDLLQDASQHEH